MIVPSGAVRVLVATRPVDFRKGMDGLAALVRESLGSDPYSGVIYVFRAKRADRVKLLLWDGTGLVLVAKRLEKSSFRWPRISDGVMRLTLSAPQFNLIGMPPEMPHARPLSQSTSTTGKSQLVDHRDGALLLCCLCKVVAAASTVTYRGPPL